MRALIILFTIITSAGCSALMVGGGTSGGSPYQKDQGSAAQTQSNATVTANVRNRLASDSRVKMFNFGVSTDNGRVTLSGTVDSYAAREYAEKLAIGTDGVRAVENQITVQSAK